MDIEKHLASYCIEANINLNTLVYPKGKEHTYMMTIQKIIDRVVDTSIEEQKRIRAEIDYCIDGKGQDVRQFFGELGTIFITT